MRIFVTGTSGWIGSAVVASERNMPEPFSGPGGRVLNGRAALALAERGVRSMGTRLVPTIHGAAGDGGGRLAGGDRARRPHAGHRQAPQARGEAGSGVRVFAVTGDDVAGFELGQAAAEPLLRGVGARCLAVDPLDPNRVYVGTFDQGLYASDDGGRTWRQDERGLMIDSSKLANHTDISTEERR